ncbi:hypothetical protein [Maribacter aquimaris]|nr:hypothetical protein [Maribacter aquimaris]
MASLEKEDRFRIEVGVTYRAKVASVITILEKSAKELPDVYDEK